MTELIEPLRQRQYFHDKYSRRAYLAHAVGKRTFRHALSYFPLCAPTFMAFDAIDYAAGLAPVDSRLTRKIITENAWKAHLFTPKQSNDENILIYFHGGAFLSCGLGTHKPFLERLALGTNNPVFAIDYRQYPEAFFATSLQDCIEAVEWALNQGYSAEQISVAGDSAGGGLALSVAGEFLTRGIKLRSVVSLSGWLDFSTPYESYQKFERRDAYIPAKRIGKIAEMILGHKPLEEHSPIYQLKKDYPPILLICGGNEILRVDTEKAYSKCVSEDLDCTMHLFSGGIHAFPVIGGLFPESTQALELVKTFLQKLPD